LVGLWRVPRLRGLRPRLGGSLPGVRKCFPFLGGGLGGLSRSGGRDGTIAGRRRSVARRLVAVIGLARVLLSDLEDLVEELVELPHRYNLSLSM
jgi:hypothetical protein